MPTRLQTWAALLRGVNVGNSRRIAMVELRDLVAGFGYGNVRTLLNSGNVLFDATPGDARDAPARIRAAMAARFGAGPRVFVRSVGALEALVTANPLSGIATDASKLVLAFYEGASARNALLDLTRRDWSPEHFALAPQAAYLWCPAGLSGGRLADAVLHAIGDDGTTRSLGTVARLIEAGQADA